jgi:hypothetical protein
LSLVLPLYRFLYSLITPWSKKTGNDKETERQQRGRTRGKKTQDYKTRTKRRDDANVNMVSRNER